MKTKIKPPKMTDEQKLAQNKPSTVARIIPAPDYADYIALKKGKKP